MLESFLCSNYNNQECALEHAVPFQKLSRKTQPYTTLAGFAGVATATTPEAHDNPRGGGQRGNQQLMVIAAQKIWTFPNSSAQKTALTARTCQDGQKPKKEHKLGTILTTAVCFQVLLLGLQCRSWDALWSCYFLAGSKVRSLGKRRHKPIKCPPESGTKNRNRISKTKVPSVVLIAENLWGEETPLESQKKRSAHPVHTLVKEHLQDAESLSAQATFHSSSKWQICSSATVVSVWHSPTERRPYQFCGTTHSSPSVLWWRQHEEHFISSSNSGCNRLWWFTQRQGLCSILPCNLF